MNRSSPRTGPWQAISRIPPSILSDFPGVTQVGLVVIAVGLLGDLVAHLAEAGEHAHGSTTGPELSAHALVLVGMLLVLAGVVIDGVRSSSGIRRQRPQGDSHALR